LPPWTRDLPLILTLTGQRMDDAGIEVEISPGSWIGLSSTAIAAVGVDHEVARRLPRTMWPAMSRAGVTDLDAPTQRAGAQSCSRDRLIAMVGSATDRAHPQTRNDAAGPLSTIYRWAAGAPVGCTHRRAPGSGSLNRSGHSGR
jgi:hypothetical protein